MPTPASNLPEYTVGEIAHALKRTIEEAYGLVRVRGELSAFKRAGSGHGYFSLKDEAAVLDAVCWRASLARLGFVPEDGLEVVCTGRLTTYPGRSRYQIVVERMEPAGAGALMALLEERRRRLAAEGLFEAERKRALPFLPEVVGVVTSPTGAVIRDILHRLEDRFPRRVLVWPVLVQGEGAAEQVAAAIRGFSALPADGAVPRPDVVIVARGGGSIEDLWAFNEEVVVRAAADCTIPLISAVGHETDTTLIDHTADRRAPTPTAAAEMAVPVRRDLLAQLAGLADRQAHAAGRQLVRLGERLDGLGRGLGRLEAALGMASQRLDDLSERLGLRSPTAVVGQLRERLDARHARVAELALDAARRARGDWRRAAARLTPASITARLAQLAPRLAREGDALARVQGDRLARASEALDALGRQLASLSHERVLERGYVIVRGRGTGQVIPLLAELGAEQELDLCFADGRLAVRRADQRPGRGRAEPAGQGRLL